MVTMTVTALSNLHCEAVHGPSHTTMQTDAPLDVGGEASSFSPTDLVGVALLTCILTTMGLVAAKHGMTMAGATGTVEKTMSDTKPRRIVALKVAIAVPLSPDADLREKLAAAAHGCPVHHSLHPDLVQEIVLRWLS